MSTRFIWSFGPKAHRQSLCSISHVLLPCEIYFFRILSHWKHHHYSLKVIQGLKNQLSSFHRAHQKFRLLEDWAWNENFHWNHHCETKLSGWKENLLKNTPLNLMYFHEKSHSFKRSFLNQECSQYLDFIVRRNIKCHSKKKIHIADRWFELVYLPFVFYLRLSIFWSSWPSHIDHWIGKSVQIF